MKRIILMCFMLLCCITYGFSQSSQEQEYEKKDKELNEKLRQAFIEKDYKLGETASKQMISLFETQPEKYQKNNTWVLSTCYYNLACFQALQKKKGTAIKSLKMAVENGYEDYRHTLNDTDLNNIRNEKEFKLILAGLREKGDFLYILQKAAEYSKNECTDTLPRFTYANPNDSNLVRVREYFKLDSVAGAGDEISKIKNILTYVHDKIMHDGQHANPSTMNAIFLAEACKDGSRGLNCRGLATVLNECYLAMGFKSRFMTCLPKVYINDCHVINTVYSNILDKWVWVDPTNNAWVMDENGILLSIQEVRERLRDGRPLVLNEDANWNNKIKQTKEEYLENYMGKNLYAIGCADRSEYGTEVWDKNKKKLNYILLCPKGFINDYPSGIMNYDYQVYDDEWFWQSPYQE